MPRLLVVSFPSVEPVNQQLFASLGPNWDVTLVAPRRWRTEYGYREAQRSPAFDGEFRTLPTVLKGNIALHAYRGRLRALVDQVRPAAVYVHHEPYGVSTWQWMRATPRDVLFGFYAAQNIVKRFPPPFSVMERQVFARSDFALPITREVAEVLERKGYRGDLRIMPLGIDERAYSPGLMRSGPPTIGYVGRLVPEKGVDTLLRASARVTAAHRLLIVGNGPQEEALRALAGKLGIADRVAWAGYTPHAEVPDEYRRMDMLVVPSKTVANWKEQLGRVVLEALFIGVPVAVSDSGELPRLIGATGGGVTFRENDDADLAARLTAHLADPGILQERAERSRDQVRETYGVESLGRQFGNYLAGRVAARSSASRR